MTDYVASFGRSASLSSQSELMAQGLEVCLQILLIQVHLSPLIIIELTLIGSLFLLGSIYVFY